ncbi:polyadenylate-binding protein-interacting protein 1 isoform X4 [Oryctolagus cuniculus]|uniref:polyadenylate-binding protein-interacting protein 1 isoform X4 n=1 Tax=Oryctolagus cuniculus TaxID=9986 RepID=UPI00222E07F5|nr:polyadenylate-binding protein-interacting protein 1 isoform X4 [Oryctolagus cuniculus]
MSDGFDRAPGAGRGRSRGLGRGGGGPEGGGFPNGAGPAERPRQQQPPPQPKAPGFQQPPPLRQPRTAPPPGAQCEALAGSQRPPRPGALPEQTRPLRAPPTSQDKIPQQNSESAMAKPQVVVAPVLMSKLSANAPEFYPSGYSNYTATSIPNFSYMGARLCNYLSHHLTISPQSGNFRQLLLQRCRTEYEVKDQAAKGDEVTRKRFHAFVLFLGELYLNLEIKGTNGQVMRADILQVGLRELLNALFSNPVDDNLICAVKLLKLTGSVLEDAWKEKGKTDMEEIIQRIENVVLDANCSRDVKQMLLKLVELRSSNWGRVHATSTYREATPENDPNYFMNEPTFYTSDGVPFTAADPDYQEKYQELLEREDFFPDYEENGTDLSGAGDPYLDDIDDEMDPEIEEAYEKFCLESERKRKQ